jgi:mycofactocin precursor
MTVTASAPTEQVEATSEKERPALATDAELVESDLLVEEISIDGMCGVY